ncbi:MAG: CoA-binding protein [Negativicutes bacterium]|nr:CoA-binding protein [Negativicutes bacterium]
MDDKICTFLQQRVWAVVGASSNPEKFGHQIFALLRRYGYTVYPVNPKETVIDGEKCYAALADLPVLPDAVDVVVPPAVALEVTQQCRQLGIERVWYQPGVANSAVITAAGSLGLDFVHGRCVMVESSKLYLLGRKTWAVVGTGVKAERLTQFLAVKGYEAYQVAPGAVPGAGVTSLAGLPLPPEAVLIVAGGTPAETAVRDSAGFGLRCIWLEAGAAEGGLLELAVSMGLTVVHGASLEEEYPGALACRPHTPIP